MSAVASASIDQADRPAIPAGRWGPLRLVVGIGLVGVVVTGAASWSAAHLDHNTEHRLLVVQTRQAVDVVQTAIAGLVGPLQTALAIEEATGGDPAQFTSFMATYVGPSSSFVSASVWPVGSGSPIASLGVAPGLTESGAAAIMARAAASSTFTVTSVTVSGQLRIGYAVADRKQPSFVVYAERAIPANRRAPVDRNSAFSELDYATYLGNTTDSSALQTTDKALSQLPLRGDIDRETIPFGDTSLTIVTTPAGHLGGTLSARLPWIFLGAGLLLTAVAAFVAGQLARRRADAEVAARTITDLYGRLDGLYGEQRTISETLQHALLPRANPAVAGLEIASRYLAGGRGVDIGGDWYSVTPLDNGRFAFVVGDVSGRGVAAAAVMARIRFTIGAYLGEGHAPDVALAMCAGQIDIMRDEHFATVLVGVGDLAGGTMVIASAGHLNPLLLTGGDARFVATSVGRPLGISPATYESTTLSLPIGATLIAFTDGLVERRDEDLDAGLGRLAATARAAADRPVDELLDAVLGGLTEGQPDDDTAVLLLRRTGPVEGGVGGLDPAYARTNER